MRRFAGVLLFGIVVAVLLVACSPSNIADSPSAIVSSSPASGGAASRPVRVINAEAEAGDAVPIAVVDLSGELADARAASLAEVKRSGVTFAPRERLLSSNLGDREVLILWRGSPCDIGATMAIGPDVASIRLEPEPRPGCDAINAIRGVVLAFDRPVLAEAITLLADPDVITQE